MTVMASKLETRLIRINQTCFASMHSITNPHFRVLRFRGAATADTLARENLICTQAVYSLGWSVYLKTTAHGGLHSSRENK